MKVSYNWLLQYIDINLQPLQVAEMLTSIGLEVESIEKNQIVKGGLQNLVIGKITSKAKHPNADKLCLTTVNIGNGNDLKIVCGAPNVEVGQKVIIAPVGTTIFPANKDPFEIREVKIRGEISEGMICAEDEIGLGTKHDGILVLNNDAKVGLLAKEYFEIIDDVVFEVSITPNRGDAASHIGVARDLAACLNKKIKIPSVAKFKTDKNALAIDVVVENSGLCQRYSGLSIMDVNIGESPRWLQNRLKLIGLKPINNIVDITNFVLHECGQPLHAFDAACITNLSSGKIGNKVIIKTLQAGTKFITLDGVERQLTNDDLMICNEEQTMCIAGVMGGKNSGINNNTKNIFLESAYFNPASIRKTAKRHDLQSDASFRFERGTDPNSTIYALKRAALLIKEIAGGKIASEIVDVYPNPIKDVQISLSYTAADTLIGQQIDRKIIKSICERLNFKIQKQTTKGLTLLVPPFKTDIKREVDVIEEILRIYGCDKISIPAKINSSIQTFDKPDKQRFTNNIAEYLSGTGFSEIISNSLTKHDNNNALSISSESNIVNILNPLSADLNIMRNSLLYGGLEAVSYNLNRKNFNIKFYEIGKTYFKKNSRYEESEHLALFLSGIQDNEQWNSSKKNISIYFIKGCVESIFNRIGINNYTTEYLNNNANKNDWYNKVFTEESLIYKNDNHLLAVSGKIQRSVLKHFDVKQDVYFADIDLTYILKLIQPGTIFYKSISKFPGVRRDLSLLIDRSVQFDEIKKIAFETNNRLLKEINIFDVYEGKQIDANKKSYSIYMILQDEHKTLIDKEIEDVMNKLILNFKSKLNAEIR